MTHPVNCRICGRTEREHPFEGNFNPGLAYQYPCTVFAPPLEKDVCKWCGGEKKITNPRGDCNHLLWPDYLSAEAKRANGYVLKKVSVWVLEDEPGAEPGA